MAALRAAFDSGDTGALVGLLHFPRLLARLFAGEAAVVMATESRRASNARAKRELGWTLRYPSWRQGFAAAYGQPDTLRPPDAEGAARPPISGAAERGDGSWYRARDQPEASAVRAPVYPRRRAGTSMSPEQPQLHSSVCFDSRWPSLTSSPASLSPTATRP